MFRIIRRALSWLFRWGEHAKFGDDLTESVIEFFGWKKAIMSGLLAAVATFEVWRERVMSSPILLVIACLVLFVFILSAIHLFLTLRERLWGSARRIKRAATPASLVPAAADESSLEILFNENSPDCVKEKRGWYNDSGVQERTWFVAIRNRSSKSIDDIVLLCERNIFTHSTMAAERFHPGKSDRDLIITELRTLHPRVTKVVKLFSLNASDIWGEQDVLAKKQMFTLQVVGRNTPPALIVLEYDPSTSPPLIRRAPEGLPQAAQSQAIVQKAAERVLPAAQYSKSQIKIILDAIDALYSPLSEMEQILTSGTWIAGSLEANIKGRGAAFVLAEMDQFRLKLLDPSDRLNKAAQQFGLYTEVCAVVEERQLQQDTLFVIYNHLATILREIPDKLSDSALAIFVEAKRKEFMQQMVYYLVWTQQRQEILSQSRERYLRWATID